MFNILCTFQDVYYIYVVGFKCMNSYFGWEQSVLNLQMKSFFY